MNKNKNKNKNKNRNKNIKIMCLSLVLSLVLTGCGATIDENTPETPLQNKEQGSLQQPIPNVGGVDWGSGDLSISSDGTVSGSFNGGYMDWSESDFNTSEYDAVKESGFLSTKTSPLSTFAADVDTASYTNLRAILMDKAGEHSYYPSEGLHDVRIEEMLNYFDYNFNGKTDGDFTISTEISTTPWNHDTQLLVMNIKAKELAQKNHSGSNLVFLIDTSGSMDDEVKLPLLKKSLCLLTNELTEKDTISIVTYSGSERVVLEGTSGSDKDTILSAIQNLEAYGSTNGESGLKKAYEIANKYKKDHSNTRVIMCSDGDLNVGMSSVDDLFDFVEEKRDSGIYLSVLGFGLGNYKDNKMETLADNGNGNYHYIDCEKEGHKVLVDDLMSTLVTLADDVKFQIEFNPKYIKGYRKIGYENRNLANEDFEDDSKDGGEIGYGHEITIVYEIVPSNSPFEIANSDLKCQETVASSDSNEWCTLSVRYKPHGKFFSRSKLLEFAIDETSYTDNPSNDWQFISNVVGFGLLVNDSNYTESLTLDNIIESLQDLELTDEYKEEFLSLVRKYSIYVEN